MAKWIISYKKSIVITFSIITIICTVLQFGVSVNYNMTDYLPSDAPSTKALTIMDEAFDQSMINTQVMVTDVTLQEALTVKKELAALDGVSDMMWLDDVVDITVPLAFQDQAIIETYYKDGHALFSFAIASGDEVEVTEAVYDIIGEDNAMVGE